jgi:hypothetical protein
MLAPWRDALNALWDHPHEEGMRASTRRPRPQHRLGALIRIRDLDVHDLRREFVNTTFVRRASGVSSARTPSWFSTRNDSPVAGQGDVADTYRLTPHAHTPPREDGDDRKARGLAHSSTFAPRCHRAWRLNKSLIWIATIGERCST